MFKVVWQAWKHAKEWYEHLHFQHVVVALAEKQIMRWGFWGSAVIGTSVSAWGYAENLPGPLIAVAGLAAFALLVFVADRIDAIWLRPKTPGRGPRDSIIAPEMAMSGYPLPNSLIPISEAARLVFEATENTSFREHAERKGREGNGTIAYIARYIVMHDGLIHGKHLPSSQVLPLIEDDFIGTEISEDGNQMLRDQKIICTDLAVSKEHTINVIELIMQRWLNRPG